MSLPEWPSGPVTIHMLHVPSAQGRPENVERLRADPRINLVVHEDAKRRGVMWNWSRMVAAIVREEGTQPWHIMVDDDIVPAAFDWVEHLKEACNHSPERILGLTHFAGAGRRAADKGAPYAVGPYCLWGAAIAVRDDVMRQAAKWCVGVHYRTGYPHDDILLPAFARHIGEQTAMTSRALFTLAEVPSVLNHYGANRQPELTIAENGPDWSTEPRFVKSDRSNEKDIRELSKENI